MSEYYMAAAGGAGDAARPAIGMSPLETAELALHELLVDSAHNSAPGPYSADWTDRAAWRADVPQSNVPGMIRAGTLPQTGEPVLLPLLGEATHYTFGDPALLKGTYAEPIRGHEVPMRHIKAERAARQEAAKKAETARQAAMRRESGVAIQFMGNIATRVLAAMPPGAVQVSWFNSQSMALPYSRNPDAAEIAFGDLSVLLGRLDDHVQAVQPVLAAYGRTATYRQLAAAGVCLPRPWQLACIANNNSNLPGLLERLLEAGPAAGITFLMHGLDARHLGATNLHNVAYGTDGYWHTAANGGVPFVMDPPAPVRLLDSARRGAAQRTAAAPALPSHESIGGRVRYQESPASRYAEQVAAAAERLTRTWDIQQEYCARFPLSTPAALATNTDNRGFLDRARLLAAAPEAMGTFLRHSMEKGGTLTQQCRNWALAQLTRHAPGALRTKLAVHFRYDHIMHTVLARNMPALAHAVAITTPQGRTQHIPAELRGWIEPHLPAAPAPWAYQLVMEAALPGRFSGKDSPEAREALALRLEQARAIQPLRNQRGEFIRPRYVAALAASELLKSYQFEGVNSAAPNLQYALARYVKDALRAVRIHDMPHGEEELFKDLQRDLTAVNTVIAAHTRGSRRNN